MSGSDPQECAKSTVDDALANSARTARNKANDKRELQKPCLPDVRDDSPFLSTKNTRRKVVLCLQNGGKRKGDVIQSSSSEILSECMKEKKKICLSAAESGSTCERPIEIDEKILTCPVCCQKVPHNFSSHVKHCADNHHVTLAQVLDGLELFQKYSKERESLGLPNSSVCHSKRKSASCKNPVSKKNNDPELDLGLALSESMKDAEEKYLMEQDEILMEAGLGHEVVDRQATLLEKYRFQSSRPVLQNNKPPRLRSGKVAHDVRPLLTRSDEDRRRLISDKVVAILSSGESVNICSSAEEFESVHYKLRSKLLLTLAADKSDLWLKASFDSMNENNCDLYYVPTLSNFIAPSNTKLGTRLKHLSQVPCRMLSPKCCSPKTSNAAELGEIQSYCVKSPEPPLINKNCNSDLHEKTTYCSEMQIIQSPQPPKESILEGVNISPRMLTKCSSPANQSPHDKINGFLFHPFQNKSTVVIQRLCHDWMSMLNNPERSDVIVKGNGYEFCCHEFVLYVRCPLILDEIVHQNCQKFIYWSSFTHESVNAFLHYVYCGDLSCLSQLSHQSMNEVLFMSKKYVLRELENIISSKTLTVTVEESKNCHNFSSDVSLQPEKYPNLQISKLSNFQITCNYVWKKSPSKKEEVKSFPDIPIASPDKVDKPQNCHELSPCLNHECAKTQNKDLQITSSNINKNVVMEKEEIDSVYKVGSKFEPTVKHHTLGSSSPDPFSEYDLSEESPCKLIHRTITLPLVCSKKSDEIASNVSCNKRSIKECATDCIREHETSNCDTLENISKCRKKLFEMEEDDTELEIVAGAKKTCVSDFPRENVVSDTLAFGSVVSTEDEVAVSPVSSVVHSDSASSSVICLPDNNAPLEIFKKQDSINIDKTCSSMHKLLEDSFLEDLGRSSLLKSSLNPELTPNNLKDVSSRHSLSSTSEGNVTPMPNFNEMDTPNLQKELGKYGIKRLKRKHAESMLKHIYEELHPVCETGCVMQMESNVIEHEIPSPSVRKCVTSAVTEKLVPNSNEEEEDYNSLNQTDLESFKTPAQERMLNNLIELELNTQLSEDSVELEQSTCDKIWNFITCNTDLYQKVLLYDPISIEEFQSVLKTRTNRPDLNRIMEFLDKQGITFQVKHNNRRKQKKGAW